MSVTSSFANVAARDVSNLVSFDFFDSLEVDVIEVNLDQEQVAFVGVSSGVSEDDVGNEVGITSQNAVLDVEKMSLKNTMSTNEILERFATDHMVR